MIRPGYFFTTTNNGAVNGGTLQGSDQLKPVFNESTTVAIRSTALYCPSYTTISIDISGTANVQIIFNPYDGTPSAKDQVAKTVTVTSTFANATYVTPGAGSYLINVTAITGTVSARASYDQDIED